MTIQEMHELFDIVQDKYSSPYFNTTEKDIMFNRAQIAYVNDTLPDNQGGVVNIELTSLVEQNLQPLIYKIDDFFVPASGYVTNNAMKSKLNTQSGDTKDFRAILNVSADGGDAVRRHVRFVRHNDFYKMEQNYFKQSSYENIVYVIESRGIQLSPDDVEKVWVTLLKMPVDVNYDTPVNCELPDHTHEFIVAAALDIAGIASRDQALLEFNKINRK